ncbi:putative transposase subunit, fragment (plasmid) [Aromatoleum aromaticum EbN1]|uniref:Transposase subunit n=1 Tax=Aromatoleum aromaticum (strain DSM 19018 / LMG 30748 / EbN1) TaxID=76114 RepID=Q5NWM8_AROAE|nr:putative transposase subunit, fragment [Aromatoleum aromaticum EbN1]
MSGRYPRALCVEMAMPAERIAIHKIRELLRLKYDCALSHERIARALSVSKGVVAKYVKAARSCLRLTKPSCASCWVLRPADTGRASDTSRRIWRRFTSASSARASGSRCCGKSTSRPLLTRLPVLALLRPVPGLCPAPEAIIDAPTGEGSHAHTISSSAARSSILV